MVAGVLLLVVTAVVVCSCAVVAGRCDRAAEDMEENE